MPGIAVIDSGGANIASLLYALQRLGARGELTVDPDRIRSATHVLLPGVGAAHDTMQRLNGNGLAAEAAAGEQETPGLGIVAGRVERLQASPSQPVPHMGWNQAPALREDPLFEGIAPTAYFYFVHSYAAPVTSDTLATCDYGGNFTAAVRYGNFRGVQFHPERSAAAGARLLANFLALE
jgi:imidazole glycerol-phosphate synthase subunit HisH